MIFSGGATLQSRLAEGPLNHNSLALVTTLESRATIALGLSFRIPDSQDEESLTLFTAASGLLGVRATIKIVGRLSRVAWPNGH